LPHQGKLGGEQKEEDNQPTHGGLEKRYIDDLYVPTKERGKETGVPKGARGGKKGEKTLGKGGVEKKRGAALKTSLN